MEFSIEVGEEHRNRSKYLNYGKWCCEEQAQNKGMGSVYHKGGSGRPQGDMTLSRDVNDMRRTAQVWRQGEAFPAE